jgi:hypothetical protein
MTSPSARSPLVFAMVGAQYIAGKAARDALFLATFDTSALPSMIIGTALFSIALVIVSSRALRRVAPETWVPVAFGLTTRVGTASVRFMMEGQQGPVMVESIGRFVLALTLLAVPASTLAQSPEPGDAGATPALASAASTAADPRRSLARDFRRVFARENAPVGVLSGAAALASSSWDHRIAASLRAQPAGFFRAGNIGGALVTEAGGAVAIMAAGRLLRQPQALELGTEMLRAQLVSQAVVQAMTVSTSRARPDASNHLGVSPAPGGAAVTFTKKP